MTEPYITDNPELDALFERYRQAPKSHVFAPLADACRKGGLVDEAVDIADRGVEENPGYTSGHVVRGKCYYDRGDRKTAMACFERVLDLDPNNLVALKFLGLIQAEEGDATGARERFKHILALDPDDREIRRELDILDVPAAEPPQTEAHEEAPPATAKVEAAPEVEADEPHFETPEDGFEGAPISLGTDDDPTSDELATMTLADIYAEQGYTDKALRIYREVLKRQPDNAGIRAKVRALEGPDSQLPEELPDSQLEEEPVDTALTLDRDEEPVVAAPEAPAADLEDGSDRFVDAPLVRAAAQEDERSEPTHDDDPTFPPAPGVAIELPLPDDFEVEADSGAEAEEDAGEPAFEEFAPAADTAPASAAKPAVDENDPNNPLPYQRGDGTIDEGRSYEQFKRWLKNLAD
jgi:tetratricopeptide (TPR) repeat protein